VLWVVAVGISKLLEQLLDLSVVAVEVVAYKTVGLLVKVGSLQPWKHFGEFFD
jgi:hypothetical protein